MDLGRRTCPSTWLVEWLLSLRGADRVGCELQAPRSGPRSVLGAPGGRSPADPRVRGGSSAQSLAPSFSQLEPELKTEPLTAIEIPDLELAARYEVSGRCRVDAEADLWGERSPALSFQTLPSGEEAQACPGPFPRNIWPILSLSFVISFILASSKRRVGVWERVWRPQQTGAPASVEGEPRGGFHFPAGVRKPLNAQGTTWTVDSAAPLRLLQGLMARMLRGPGAGLGRGHRRNAGQLPGRPDAWHRHVGTAGTQV